MNRLEVVVLVATVLLMLFTVEVLRRRRLSESYALLWLGVGLGALVLGLARPLIDRVSSALGIAYGTSLVFGVALLFLLAVCINLSIHVSKLESRVETLAEEVALLRGPVARAPHAGPDPGAPAAAADPVAADGPDDVADVAVGADAATAPEGDVDPGAAR